MAGFPPANVGGTGDFPGAGIFGNPYFTAFNSLRTIGKAFGFDPLGDLAGKVFGKDKRHPHVSAQLTARQFNHPVMKAMRLEFPELNYHQNNQFQSLFDKKQSPIDKFMDVTKKWFPQFGQAGNDLLATFNKQVAEVKQYINKSNTQEGKHAGQQGYIDALGAAWSELDKGLPSEVKDELYRQVQVDVLGINTKDMFNEIKQNVPKNTRSPKRSQSPDSRFSLKDAKLAGSFQGASQRLRGFQEEFYPDLLDISAPPADIQRELTKAKEKFNRNNTFRQKKGGLARQKQFGNTLSPRLREAYDAYGPRGGSTAIMDYFLRNTNRFIPPSSGVAQLQTPVGDINNFLSSFNPQQSTTGGINDILDNNVSHETPQGGEESDPFDPSNVLKLLKTPLPQFEPEPYSFGDLNFGNFDFSNLNMRSALGGSTGGGFLDQTFQQEEERNMAFSPGTPFSPTTGNLFSARQKPISGLAFLS